MGDKRALKFSLNFFVLFLEGFLTSAQFRALNEI